MPVVGFPASGVDLQAIFRFSGCARRHPIRVIILPSSTDSCEGYSGDMLSGEFAALGVEGLTVEVLES